MNRRSPVIDGRYRIEGILASGGMAEIYLATEIGPKGPLRRVAIKRILPHLARQSRFREMFFAEAELAARCEHANLVRVYAVIEEAGELYLVQEFVDGADLSQIIDALKRRGEPMPEEYAALIALGVARGLEYIHNLTDDDGKPLGMLHRDISPTNIMVSRTGEVKLIDFGVAKRAGQMLSEPHELKGKIGYMAPEQIGQGNIGPHTDIYGLGLVIYELVALEHAIKGGSVRELLAAASDPKVVPVGEIRDDLSAEFVRIIERSIAPEIEDRYLDAHELEGDLIAYFASRRQPTPHELGEFVGSLGIEHEVKPWRRTAVLPTGELDRRSPLGSPSEKGRAARRLPFGVLIPIALFALVAGLIALTWMGLRLFGKGKAEQAGGTGGFAPAVVRVAGEDELMFCRLNDSVVLIPPGSGAVLGYEDVRGRTLVFGGRGMAAWRYTPKTLRKTPIRVTRIPIEVPVDFESAYSAFELDGRMTQAPCAVPFGWHLIWALDETGKSSQQLAPFVP
ncbi:MAG TPA: serine/threonine protein kinase [Proteobacteria bacterium]|nr:serine/threonine protein kinase [Pseudomonadota bacterium]